MGSSKPRRALPASDSGRRPWLIGALIGGLALAGGGVAASQLLNPATPAPRPATANPTVTGAATTPQPCATTVAVAVDPALADLATSLFAAYGATRPDACSPLAASALSGSDLATKGLGSAKAWIPEDALWQQRAVAGGMQALATASATPIGWTPLVVAAPKELADAVGRPLAGETLTDLVALRKSFADYGKPEWGRLKLVLPDTQATTAGGSAFASLAMQVSRGEAPPARGQVPTANQAAMAQTQYRVVEEAPTAAAVLDLLATNPADANALTGAGPRVGVTTELAALRRDGVVAAHLDGGATSAHLALIDTSGDEVVKGFAAWLATDAGRAAVTAAGLRSGDRTPDAALLSARGLTSPVAEGKQATLEQVGTGAALAKAMSTRMSILTVLDISGSMGTVIPGTQVRRIDLVSQASTFDWDTWPPGSRIGFMTFHTDEAFKTQIQPIVPYITNTDPAWLAAKPMMQSALARIQTSNGTPLFSAIGAGYEYALANRNPAHGNRVIVLTDGKQEKAVDSITEKELLARMPRNVADQGIQLVLVGLGPDADMATLQRVAAATGATAIQVRDIAQYPAVASQIMAP